jgi:hypothetical protein
MFGWFDLKSEFSSDEIIFDINMERNLFSVENKMLTYYKSVNIPKLKVEIKD